jgi:type I restriction enzyme, R subunit
MTDDGLRQAAAVNPEDKFELVFKNLLERLFIERIDQNEEIFVRFMNDVPFQKAVTEWMVSEAYRRLRGESGEADSLQPARVLPPRLRLVEGRPEERYVSCVPLVPLKVAAGAFSDPQNVAGNDFEWVAVESRRQLGRGMFVAQVVGESMEPAIPDGSYCLFVAPVTGTRKGKTVLVQLRDATDPETGERYTVKRYESEKATNGDSWRQTRITLRPMNPDFQPIVLTDASERQLQVVAEFLEVLGP